MRGFSAFVPMIVLLAASIMSIPSVAVAQEQAAGVEQETTDIRDMQDILRARPSSAEPIENPEEPAMRPITGLFRGIGAFFYQVGKSLAEGNEKFPGLGTIEVVRGARKGAIELTESTYRGMMHSESIPHRELGKTNRIIENDPFLRHTADTVVPGAIVSLGGAEAESAVIVGLSVKAAQEVTDKRIFESEPTEELEVPQSEYEKNREKYLGDRANINKDTKGTGNLLKLARR